VPTTTRPSAGAVWLYSKKSRPVAKETLEALRHRRNQYVHSGRVGEGSDQVAYLIKSLVDPHLVKLIQNPFGVTSLKDYGAFLDLPTDPSALEEHRRMLTRAVEFIRGPRERES
jgi:hypothetical protein